MSQLGTIKYADVLMLWDKLSKIDSIEVWRKTPCQHCGAPSLEGPHSPDCPWVRLDRFCAALEANGFVNLTGYCTVTRDEIKDSAT